MSGEEILRKRGGEEEEEEEEGEEKKRRKREERGERKGLGEKVQAEGLRAGRKSQPRLPRTQSHTEGPRLAWLYGQDLPVSL